MKKAHIFSGAEEEGSLRLGWRKASWRRLECGQDWDEGTRGGGGGQLAAQGGFGEAEAKELLALIVPQLPGGCGSRGALCTLHRLPLSRSPTPMGCTQALGNRRNLNATLPTPQPRVIGQVR